MINPSQLLNPHARHQWQLPVGVMEGVVAYNCRTQGFPLPELAMPMWEGAGNRTMDLSRHRNYGTVTNDLVWRESGRGASLDFNGVDTYVDVDNLNPLLTDRITVSVWATRSEGINAKHIISRHPGWFIAELWGGDLNMMRFGTNTGSEVNTPTYTISDADVMHHFVGKYDGSYVYFYVDGIEIGKTAQTGDMSSGGTMRIGAYWSSGYNWYGLINNVSIFGAALTAAQIKYMYDDPYFMYRTPEELYGYTVAAGGISIPVIMHHLRQQGIS